MSINAINNFVMNFFTHCESICEESGLDLETMGAMRKEWEEWKKENEVEIEKEVKKEVKKAVKKAEKKREKKPKDAPKNARSAYILFSNDMRPDIKREHPDLDAKDTLKALGALWKNADEDIKAKYQELANEDKARFKEEMENYVPTEVVEKDKKEKDKKVKKPKGAPKNARSAYIFYSQDARAIVKKENPEMNGKEVMTEMELMQNCQT